MESNNTNITFYFKDDEELNQKINEIVDSLVIQKQSQNNFLKFFVKVNELLAIQSNKDGQQNPESIYAILEKPAIKSVQIGVSQGKSLRVKSYFIKKEKNENFNGFDNGSMQDNPNAYNLSELGLAGLEAKGKSLGDIVKEESQKAKQEAEKDFKLGDLNRRLAETEKSKKEQEEIRITTEAQLASAKEKIEELKKEQEEIIKSCENGFYAKLGSFVDKATPAIVPVIGVIAQKFMPSGSDGNALGGINPQLQELINKISFEKVMRLLNNLNDFDDPQFMADNVSENLEKEIIRQNQQ